MAGTPSCGEKPAGNLYVAALVFDGGLKNVWTDGSWPPMARELETAATRLALAGERKIASDLSFIYFSPRMQTFAIILYSIELFNKQ